MSVTTCPPPPRGYCLLLCLSAHYSNPAAETRPSAASSSSTAGPYVTAHEPSAQLQAPAAAVQRALNSSSLPALWISCEGRGTCSKVHIAINQCGTVTRTASGLAVSVCAVVTFVHIQCWKH
jgi:hypothetical protein